MKAFEVEALDYLVKPLMPSRLAEAISRYKRANFEDEEDTKSVFFLNDGNKVYSVTPQEIVAIEADSSFTRIHRTNGSALYIRRAISEWEAKLSNPPFVRLDRSLIINIEKVKELRSLTRDNSILFMHGIKQEFSLGRVALTCFRKLKLTD